MASSYTDTFNIEKIGSGEQSGTWGTTTNHNLDIIDRLVSYTAIALSDASTATLVIGETSPASGTENLQNGMYRVIKFTGTLSQDCTITISPNDRATYFIIENAATDDIILSQGSGANVTVQSGKNVIVYCDGAGGGAAVVDALADLQVGTLEVTGAAAIDGAATLGSTLTVTGASQFNSTITVGVDDTGYDVKFFGDTASRYWEWDTSADGVVQRGTLTVGVDDAGHDVKFFGDTASAYMLWDTSIDDLVLAGGARFGVGTTSPSYPIHQVQAGGDTSLEIQTTGAAYAAELRLNSGGANPAAYITGRSSGTENWRVGSNSEGNTLELKTGANALSHFTFSPSGAAYNDDHAAALDFRVESDTNANMIFVDSGNDRVGIGTASPSSPAIMEIYANNANTGGMLKLNQAGAGDPNITMNTDGVTALIGLDHSDSDTFKIDVGTTATGSQTRFAIDTSGNVLLGGTNASSADGCVYTPTEGTANLRLGNNAGEDIVSGCNYNVILGDDAGNSLNSGDANVFVGQKAGYDETGGYGNVAVGYQAGENSDGADYYVAVGTQALQDQDDGQFNTAVGYFSMGDATDTGYNVGVGPYTFQKGTSGSYGVAIANGAGRDNTSAHYNICIGYHSMLLNTTGENNVAIGGYSLDATVTGGSYNVAVGHSALGVAGSAAFNTAIGYNALGALTTGQYNVAVGGNALSSNTITGDGNVGVGQNALYALGAAASNTAIGNYAGDNLTTGSNNTCLGSHAQPSAADSTQQIVIGDNISGGENNQVTIGKTSNVIQNEFDTDAAWTRTSDVRKKRNIQEDELGLEFVNNLRTVTYQWKPSNEFPKEWDEYSEENNMNLDAVMHGMIAQEVKEALDKSGCDTFTGWKERSDGSQTVSREMFVMPLIKAVQELSAKVKELEDKLDG